MAASIGSRISELAGTAYETVPSTSKADLINSAVAEVVDMLPADLLLKYSAGREVLTSASYDAVEGKKVLLVTREVDSAVGTPTMECTPVLTQELLKCADSSSLYEATKYSPVYGYEPQVGGGSILKVLPEPTADEEAIIHYFEYPTTDQSGNTTLSGLPNEVIQAVVLKASINILQSYISDFVQEEEDAEMQQMVEAQKGSLMQSFQMEMSRYMEKDATPRGE